MPESQSFVLLISIMLRMYCLLQSAYGGTQKKGRKKKKFINMCDK